MSEEKKGGFFRRLFKRVDNEGQDVSPEPVAPAEPEPEELAGAAASAGFD